MNSRNSAVSKYLDAKQDRRRKARYRQKRLKMGLPAAVQLKHVSLDQKEKETIASTEAIGTAKQKKFFVTRHFAWPVSLGFHVFAGFLLTIYAIQEYIPEEEPVFVDFVEEVQRPRTIGRPNIIRVRPPDALVIEAPPTPVTSPTDVEIPEEQARFYTPTDNLLDVGAAPSSGVSLPDGFGNVPVQQQRAEIPTEAPGVKIYRDPQLALKDTELRDISDPGLGGRNIDAEVEVQVDQNARVLRKVEPKYPEAAKRAQREALVNVECTVGVDGRATDIRVVEPKGYGFDDAAIEAVNKWRFTPAKKGGESVPQRVKIPIRFTLED